MSSGEKEVEKCCWLRPRRKLLVLMLIVLLVSSATAYYYVVTFVKPPIIGVLEVKGAILAEDQVALYSQAITEAMLNDSVKGVVLKIDSPGGYADLVEQLYLDLLELRGRKPLIASVTMALSGGYYIAVASDYIYAHPTSMVGNIGVMGVGPPILVPSEMVLESGAHKATGYSRLLFAFNLSRALNNFVNAVKLGRGNRLKLSLNELRRGSIYMGSEAVEKGLIDELGSLQSALKKVAQASGIVRYSVVNLVELVRSRIATKTSLGEETPWVSLTVDRLNEIHPPPSIYYLYLPTNTSFFASGISGQTFDEGVSAEGRGLVLVDKSHGNRVSYMDLEALIRELMLRNVTVSFIASWSSLESKLDSAIGVIIAVPTTPYSEKQVEKLKGFVRSGKALVIMYDPAAEYVTIPNLTWPVNSLSTGFGILFNSGYLYDEEQFFGMYRNIYVDDFKSHALTLNLSRVVLFTSTGISSTGKGIAWSSNTTFSSVAERPDRYEVISVVELNGTVVAIGDLTFMREPYCYAEDNYGLVRNLASLITLGARKVKTNTENKEIKGMLNKPDLPAGTLKVFLKKVDGKEHELRWYKTSSFEIRIEENGSTTRYILNENGSLLKVIQKGLEVVYEKPIPEPPYPLKKGDSWRHESNYTLKLLDENRSLKGMLTIEEEVVGFATMNVLDDKSYFCAEIAYTYTDSFERDGLLFTIISRGRDWISYEAGLVKEEGVTSYYLGSTLRGVENRMLVLKSIRK